MHQYNQHVQRLGTTKPTIQKILTNQRYNESVRSKTIPPLKMSQEIHETNTASMYNLEEPPDHLYKACTTLNDYNWLFTIFIISYLVKSR